MKTMGKLVKTILLVLLISCQQKTVQLDINANPEKASVYLNEEKIGTTPLKTKINPGAIKILVKKEGYEDFVFLDTFRRDTILNIFAQLIKKEEFAKMKTEENEQSSIKSKSVVINCPILIGPRGAQLFVSFESAKLICNNRIKYVSIVAHSAKPVTVIDTYRKS